MNFGGQKAKTRNKTRNQTIEMTISKSESARYVAVASVTKVLFSVSNFVHSLEHESQDVRKPVVPRLRLSNR